MRFEDSLSLREARARFFAESKLGPDGGYSVRWVRVEAKPFPLYFPNTRGRVRAAKLHDLHHIATEYGVDWPGEIEIAAFELAFGCGNYAWAWLLNLGAFTIGLVVAPRRAFRAFVRGRRAKSLYQSRLEDDRLDTMTVGSLRDALALRQRDLVATRADARRFIVWAVVGIGYHLVPGLVAGLTAWMIWRTAGVH